MTFTRLNGWKLPVKNKTPGVGFDYHGELGRAFTNRQNRARRAAPRRWKGNAFPMESPCAMTLRALLEGRGHHVPLTRNLWSLSGLGPEDGALTSFVEPVNSDLGPPGYDSATQMTGNDGVVWDADLCADRWTIIYWESLNGGATWTRRAFRSDLARWVDGVRNDAALQTYSIVEDGAVSLFDVNNDEPHFAGLVILPYCACDEFVEQEYLWLTANEMVSSWRLNGTPIDYVGGNDGTAFGVFFGESSFGTQGSRSDNQRMALLSGGLTTDRVAVGSADELGVFVNTGGVSVEGWVRTNGLGSTDVGLLYSRTNFGLLGLTLQLTRTGVADTEYFIDGIVRYAGGSHAQATSTVRLVQTDEFAHVAMVWYPPTAGAAASTVRIFFNGKRVTDLSVNTVGVGAVGDDQGGLIATLGGLDLGGSGIQGFIEAWSFYRRAMSDEDIADAFECGNSKRYVPAPRQFSNLPGLELAGDVVDCVPVEVMGREENASYVQHGSKTGAGWKNNSRDVAYVLEERVHKRPSLPVRATVAFQFDELITRELGGVAARVPLIGGVGGLGGAVSIGTLAYTPFPFGPFRVRDFTGPAQYEALGLGPSNALVGAHSVSVLAFAKCDSNAVPNNNLLSMEVGANTSRFFMDRTGGAVRCGGRSIGGEGLELATSNWTDTRLNEWMLYGGFMDIAGQRCGVMQVRNDTLGKGGLLIDYEIETGKTFTAPNLRITNEPDIDNRCGEDVNNNSEFSGAISHMYLFVNHIITRSEALAFWHAWQAGVFK